MKRALILGIGGQDGSYLAEVLLEQGYEVHGLHRRSSVDNLWRIAHIRNRVTLHQGDLLDVLSIQAALKASDPQEVYNEADQDSVPWSYAVPGYSLAITAGAVINLLETVLKHAPHVKVFQPISATIFGDTPGPQNEQSDCNPQSPYAAAKLAALDFCAYYRRVHGLFVTTAIMYNHESPKRGPEYLLQSICRQAVEIVHGTRDFIAVSDLDKRVDVGWSREYMQASHKLMKLERSSDYVMGMGIAPTIREWIDAALEAAGASPMTTYRIEKANCRPGNPENLVANSTKLREAIGWNPLCGKEYIVKALVQSWREKLK